MPSVASIGTSVGRLSGVPTQPPLRYLDGATVEACIPPVEERLRLASVTMRALADGSAQLPPKIGLSPRPQSSFAHAMPAHLRAADPADDLVGVKWVLGFPTNSGVGVPGIHAVAVLNDPATGVPTAILDAGPITAHRTAAVTGLAIRHWGPRDLARPARVAIVGAGTQAVAHLPVLAHLLPDVDLAIYTRRPDRAEALADRGASRRGNWTRDDRGDRRGGGPGCRCRRHGRVVRAREAGHGPRMGPPRCPRRAGGLRDVRLGSARPRSSDVPRR